MLLIVELLFMVLLSMVLFLLYRSEWLSKKGVAPRARIEEYWSENERRQCVRFRKELGINYTVEKKTHLKSSGKAMDISESGIKLLLDEKLANGTILDLRVIDPHTKKILEIEGTIVWSEEASDEKDPSGKRLFHAGLKFLGVRSPSGILVSEFIRSLCVGKA